ncbi:MAG: hypothetical protein ACLFMS_01995 [Halorhodospira sp.]
MQGLDPWFRQGSHARCSKLLEPGGPAGIGRGLPPPALEQRTVEPVELDEVLSVGDPRPA